MLKAQIADFAGFDRERGKCSLDISEASTLATIFALGADTARPPEIRIAGESEITRNVPRSYAPACVGMPRPDNSNLQPSPSSAYKLPVTRVLTPKFFDFNSTKVSSGLEVFLF
jgi:hypothetical protein